MKMNIRGWLLAPWIILFTVVITSIIVAGSKYHIDLEQNKYALYFFILGIVYCMYLNFKSITKAGIWISHSIPKYLKMNSWQWLARVAIAFLVALIFYKFGQISWVPLYWQGFVLPMVLSLVLIVIITNILSPILIWCANFPLTRFTALIGSSAVLILLPLGGVFMGEMILQAYEASLPRPFVLENKTVSIDPNVIDAKAVKTVLIENKDKNNKLNLNKKNNKKADKNSFSEEEILQVNLQEPKSDLAKKLKALALRKGPCIEESGAVLSALHERNSDEVVFWAARAVECANLRPVIALTKLVDIMLKHNNPKVKAAAIMAMATFKTETVQNLGYLLVKQISEKQPPVVIEAASYVFSRLGITEYNWTMRRLKGLLTHAKLHRDIADIIVRVMNREDLILDYIVTNLNESKGRNPTKMVAVEMVCSLPKKSLTQLEPQVSKILSLIDSGDNHDPAKMALDCLGAPGIKAIRDEIKNPKILNRLLAARVFSQMDIKNSKEALETVSSCINDRDIEMRKICSTSLGKVGVEDKKFGEHALSSLEDPAAKEDLLVIRAKNSGWSTTQKRLSLVRSIDSTLLRIDDIQNKLNIQKNQQEEGQIKPIKMGIEDSKNKTTL
jgi:hypothetical protein